MRRETLISLVLVLLLISWPARADSWICPICHQTFNFDPRDSSYKASWTQMHMAAHGSGSIGYSGNSAVQSMAPLVQGVFNMIGQSMANAIMSRQIQQQQMLELRRQEELRLAEEMRRAAEERRRREEEMHRRLMAELKPLDMGGELSSKGLDDLGGSLTLKGLDDNLRPAGTSFFGLGGDKPAQPADAPVDLRNLPRASFLASKAVAATTTDADLLFDEALRVADGEKPVFNIPDDAVPVIGEDGLKAFQKANAAYRQAHRDDIAAMQEFTRAQDNHELLRDAVQQIHDRPDLLATGGSDSITRQAEEAERALREQLQKARTKLDVAQAWTSWSNTLRRMALRFTVDPDPLLRDMLPRDNDPLSTDFRKRVRDAYDLYQTGTTEQEKLRGKAALEKARADAVEDLRQSLKEWREFGPMERAFEEASAQNPRVRALSELPGWSEVVKEADRIIKKGALPLDMDLGFLFDPDRSGARRWPGPRNPESPLSNPLVIEASERRTREQLALYLWDKRREQMALARRLQTDRPNEEDTELLFNNIYIPYP
jgi:hypothetical protein